MKLQEWMRWPTEDVENDRRIHLPVPSIPGRLTPPGPTGRGERADNTEQLPSRLHPSSSTTQGKERQRGDVIVLLMSPGSGGQNRPSSLPPSLPPPGVACLPLGEAAPVLPAELARSCKGGSSTFPAGQSSQLSWSEAAREEIPLPCWGGRPAPGNSTKAVTRAGLSVCRAQLPVL